MTPSNYVTKGFLTTKLSKLKEELRSEIKNSKKSVKDVILDSELRILKELKDMREEFEVHQFSHQRINQEIEELQKKVGII